jgi:hypothetical protein
MIIDVMVEIIKVERILLGNQIEKLTNDQLKTILYHYGFCSLSKLHTPQSWVCRKINCLLVSSLFIVWSFFTGQSLRSSSRF